MITTDDIKKLISCNALALSAYNEVPELERGPEGLIDYVHSVNKALAMIVKTQDAITNILIKENR